MPNYKTRPIDTMAKKNYSWWGRSFVFIEKTKIKTWQAIFIIAFVSGMAVTLVWTVSNDWHPFSKAAMSSNSIILLTPNGGERIVITVRTSEGLCPSAG